LSRWREAAPALRPRVRRRRPRRSTRSAGPDGFQLRRRRRHAERRRARRAAHQLPRLGFFRRQRRL